MKPRTKAPLTESVPYIPKICFFWNGFGMLQGAWKLPERLHLR